MVLQASSQASLIETDLKVNVVERYRQNYKIEQYPDITLEDPIFKSALYRKLDFDGINIENIANSFQLTFDIVPFTVYSDQHNRHYVLASNFIFWANEKLLPEALENKSVKDILHHFKMTTFKAELIENDGYYSGLYQVYNPLIGMVRFELIPINLALPIVQSSLPFSLKASTEVSPPFSSSLTPSEEKAVTQDESVRS